jgi:hypothetical protein
MLQRPLVASVIVCLVFASPVYAGNSFLKKFAQLSFPEKLWVISHPFVARKAYHISEKAIEASRELKKDSLFDGDENGGQIDAFRHSYWMALLTKKIGGRKAYKLGLAHEKGNKIAFRKLKSEEGALPDSVSSLMDLENNKTGIAIGKTYKNKNEEEIKEIVKQEILKGEMQILLKDKEGNFTDCSGNRINMAEYTNKWEIPKCLVKSDRVVKKGKK